VEELAWPLVCTGVAIADSGSSYEGAVDGRWRMDAMRDKAAVEA